jgi:hypothetical protein
MYVTRYELTKRHSAQGVCIRYGEGKGREGKRRASAIEAALDGPSLTLDGISKQARQGCWTRSFIQN